MASMAKRRVTVSLDEDLVEAMKSMSDRSMSEFTNTAVRDAVERKAHQAAVLEWLEEQYAQHGRPSEADYAEADALLDSLSEGTGVNDSAA